MRKNFYELLSEVNFNVLREYKTLMNMFKTEKVVEPFTGFSSRSQFFTTIYDRINTLYFRSMDFRGSFTSIDEMFDALKIPNISSKMDDLLLLCEILVAFLFNDMVMDDNNLYDASKNIMSNINYILEKTNHELHEIAQNRWVIVEKNKYAKQAAQIIDDPSVAIKLLEYNHFALKGNLDEKKNILLVVANYIEPLLKSRKLEKHGYKKLQSDIGFLLNNFNVRHNNKEGEKAQDYIVSLDDAQLEEWYDRIYNTALSVILLEEHLPVENEIAELKEKYNWKS